MNRALDPKGGVKMRGHPYLLAAGRRLPIAGG